MPVGLPPAPPLSPPREPPARPSPPEAPPGDVDLIFRTIEQLTLKLNRLKAVERAHRELLRSLGRSSSADATPLGGSAPEMEPWGQQPPSPDSPLSRALRSLQGPATSAPGSRAPLAEAPPPDPDL